MCDLLYHLAVCIVPGQGGKRSWQFQDLIHHCTVIALQCFGHAKWL